MKINWFPGHMNASLKMLDKHIRQCDIILYVLDARCPKSCLNPSFESYISRKPVLFVLNKADLAPRADFKGIPLNSTKTNSAEKLIPQIRKLLPNKTRIHAMVIGVPNCGKSTLINNLVGKAKTKTADRPGVTRAPQWVSIENSPPQWKGGGDSRQGGYSPPNGGVAAHGGRGGLYLLDTPGILWPNLEDQRVARNLAFIGSIKDDVLDVIELARELLVVINNPDTLEEFAKKRGHLLTGGKPDLLRAATTVLHEFRAGKAGKFNLDNAE